MKIAPIAIAALLLATAPPASAQWNVQIQGGPTLLTSRVNSHSGPLETNDNDEGGLFRLAAGYRVSGYTEPSVNIRGGFAPLDVGFLDRLKVISLTTGGQFFPLGKNRFRPHLGADVDRYHTEMDIERFFSSRDSTAEDDAFGFDVRGGSDYDVSYSAHAPRHPLPHSS